MTHILAPLRIDPRGRLAAADGQAYVRSLMDRLLLTAPGERINRPSFGSGLMQLVFAPSDDAVAAATRLSVRATLEQHLRGIARIEDVDASSDDATIRIVVRYRLPDGGTDVVEVTHEVSV